MECKEPDLRQRLATPLAERPANRYIKDMALTNSKKVSLTKKIITHLAAEEWPWIDFTLSQFEFPVTDSWSGTKEAYIIEMLGEGSDAHLVELADHCEGKQGAVAPDQPYWEADKLRVFISHLSGKKKQATALQDALSPYGMSSFVAHKDIHPTLEWQAEIESALQTCELVVALIYPGFNESDWCDQEIGWALGRGVPVFTVRVGADPKGFVSRFQAFTGSGKNAEEIAVEVFDAILSHKMLQKRMAEITVKLFVKSENFATSKLRMGHLEKLRHWEPSFSKRILKAADENYEISAAFGVPDRVKALVTKWKKNMAAVS